MKKALVIFGAILIGMQMSMLYGFYFVLGVVCVVAKVSDARFMRH